MLPIELNDKNDNLLVNRHYNFINYSFTIYPHDILYRLIS